MLWPSWLHFITDWSFKMRHSMNFQLNWYRNYERQKLNICFSFSKLQSFNSDLSQFLYQLRQNFLLYLILKFQSILKWSQEGQSMVAFLYCKTPAQKQIIYFINRVILILICTSLQVGPNGMGPSEIQSYQQLTKQQ